MRINFQVIQIVALIGKFMLYFLPNIFVQYIIIYINAYLHCILIANLLWLVLKKFIAITQFT